MKKHTFYSKKTGVEILIHSDVKEKVVTHRVRARFFNFQDQKENDSIYFFMEPSEAHNLARHMSQAKAFESGSHNFEKDGKKTSTIVRFQIYTRKDGNIGYALVINRRVEGKNEQSSMNVPLNEADLYFCADLLRAMSIDAAVEQKINLSVSDKSASAVESDAA